MYIYIHIYTYIYINIYITYIYTYTYIISAGEENILEKVALSHGMQRSVKIDRIEAFMNALGDSLKALPSTIVVGRCGHISALLLLYCCYTCVLVLVYVDR